MEKATLLESETTTEIGVIERDVPLAPLTTLGVGGPARFFVTARSPGDLFTALQFASEERVPLLVLGGGSNVVIADTGYAGLVVHLDVRGIETEEQDGAVLVTASAGEPWDAFVSMTVVRGWAGLECLSGIPGRVGATPIQNVGAYGQEVSETIVSVDAIDRLDGSPRTFCPEECGFAYRTSRFKHAERDRWIITAVTFRLIPAGAANIRYAELKANLEREGIRSSDLAAVREAVLTIRRQKGMVLDPADPDTRSDGSFFTNPVLSSLQFAAFIERVAKMSIDPSTVPRFAAGEQTKVPAAWLIEQAGFHKGHRLGNAGISTKHSLAIVNCGGATAREVLDLAREIRAGVKQRFGLRLEMEPVVVE